MSYLGLATTGDLERVELDLHALREHYHASLKHYDAMLKHIVSVLKDIKPESFKEDVNPETAKPAQEKPYTWEDAMRNRLTRGP